MSKYTPTIGLEIHAELNTRTKMFCDCLNDPEETRPNFNVCPVCLAHPGVLPTINQAAVKSVIKLGLALGARIPEFSKFDRKNYFYPDLPKGYQLSQYEEPFVLGGKLAGINITRVHLEEDTGRLQHDGGHSLIDYNRAGRPLMELVTEPDIHSADEALIFAKELQLLLRYLNISSADMEKGHMRVEANISISDTNKLGTKVEVKNLNSFKAVKDAIAYELKRHEEVLLGGGKIIQETRGWDDIRGTTYTQRAKEEAHDYRYLPEPDLPPVITTAEELEKIRKELPELPSARRERFMREFGLKSDQADILTQDKTLAAFFEATVSEFQEEMNSRGAKADTVLAYNYLTSDLLGLAKSGGIGIAEAKVDSENFADLLVLIQTGEISSRTAKDILLKMFEVGGDPREIMKTENLGQISDEGELKKMVHEIIEANPNVVADYRKGKMPALEALIGRAMGKLKGRGNPEVLRRLFSEELSK